MLTTENKAAMSKFTESHYGNKLDQQKMLKPNPMVAKILVARLASMTDQQQESLKTILTPETKDALKVLIPEFGGVFEKRLEASGTDEGAGAANAGTAG